MVRRIAAAALGIALLALCYQAAFAAAPPKKYDGPQRITRMDGKVHEGTVEVDPSGDKFVIRPTKFPDMTITLKKREILKIEAIANAPAANKPDTAKDRPSAEDEPKLEAGSYLLTDEQIAEILRGIEIDPGSLSETGDPEASLPVNEESVTEMMRIAGAGAEAKRLETDHFVFVYTSGMPLAKKLAATLEGVYRWNVWLLKQTNMPYQQPDYKLEVYFFGKHEEYARYQNLLGQEDSVGVLGFYRPDMNRSAFFDMDTWPPVKQRREQADNPSTPPNERRRIKNLLKKWFDWKNLEVVQHEAAHHIHFNVGVFAREVFTRNPGALPRWTVEGLATMFELPPTTDLGAALGAINHQRVKEFREFFGKDGSRLPPMRDFVLDDMIFLRGGGTFYPLGWAMTQYLWNKKREEYARWLRALSEINDRETWDRTERQALFEDIFGEMNDEWVKKFVEYIDTITLQNSKLPVDLDQI